MKKLFIVLFVLFSLNTIACAEQDNYGIEGEWYVGLLYENRGLNATEDSNGNFIVNYADEQVFFGKDGTFESESEGTFSVKHVQLSDNAFLYYDVQDDVLHGELFLWINDELKLYSISSAPALLITDEEIIAHDSGERLDYFYMTNGNLYLIDKNEGYTRGSVTFESSGLFIYNIDEEPSEKENTSFDRGASFMAFISTSTAGR